MNLGKRSYKKEFLDDDNIPFSDIKRNLQELNYINTWLGGHKITVEGFKKIAGKKKDISICEIGCGGGDNLAAIMKWCKKQNISLKCTGIDMKAECIDFAKQNAVLNPHTRWITSDYENVSFAQKPDIIFSSLFCHHFNESQLTAQLCWMKNNSALGFFINDLERNAIAFYAINMLTKLFSSSYLVKNDAPLSVARGLKRNEWMNIFSRAKIKNYSIKWKWAFRYLITFTHA